MPRPAMRNRGPWTRMGSDLTSMSGVQTHTAASQSTPRPLTPRPCMACTNTFFQKDNEQVCSQCKEASTEICRKPRFSGAGPVLPYGQRRTSLRNALQAFGEGDCNDRKEKKRRVGLREVENESRASHSFSPDHTSLCVKKEDQEELIGAAGHDVRTKVSVAETNGTAESLPQVASHAPTIRTCLKCRRKSTNRLRVGPDGIRTLCNKCGLAYQQCKLPLFQRTDGSLTVLFEEGMIPVVHQGFEAKKRPERGRDYSRPTIMIRPEAGNERLRSAVRKGPVRRAKSRKQTKGENSDLVMAKAEPEKAAQMEDEDFFGTEPIFARWYSQPQIACKHVAREEKDGLSGNARIVVAKDKVDHGDMEVPSPNGALPAMQSSPQKAVANRTINRANTCGASQPKGVPTGVKSSLPRAVTETNVPLAHTCVAPQPDAFSPKVQLSAQAVLSELTMTRAPVDGQLYIKASMGSGEDECLRRFPVSVDPMAYEVFHALLQNYFNTPRTLAFQYEDNEGDYVNVSRDVEVEEMHRIVQLHRITPVRLRVYDSEGEKK